MDNSNYISSLSFLQHSFVQGREILSSVLDVQNEEEGFLDVMQALGKLKPTSQPVSPFRKQVLELENNQKSQYHRQVMLELVT